MKIPTFLLTLACSAGLALQAWTLNQVVELKAQVSSIRTALHLHDLAHEPNH